MPRTADVHEQIKTHLWEVAAHLGQARPDERADILYSLESQIYEALAEHGSDPPTTEQVNTVLAELPVPHTYGPMQNDAESAVFSMAGGAALRWTAERATHHDRLPPSLLSDHHYCWDGVTGLVLACLAVVMLFFGVVLVRYGDVFSDPLLLGTPQLEHVPSNVETVGLIGVALLVLCLISLITASYLGGSAIVKIQQSEWALRGLWPALIARLSFVLVLFDGVLYIVLYVVLYLLGGRTTGVTALLLDHLGILAFIVGIDYLILRIEWRNLQKTRQMSDRSVPPTL